VKVVFAGSIGRFPVGGHAWVDMNYLAGLVALGHDVTYVEECGAESWVYDWHAEAVTNDLAYPSDYVARCLADIGLADRWAYRAGDVSVGLSTEAIGDACAEADVLLIRGCSLPLWRPEYLQPRTRVFVDSDPGFTQVRALTTDPELAETIDRSERLFTIGAHVGREGCPVPTLGRSWTATEPPVALSLWPVTPGDVSAPVSTVLQWRSYCEVSYGGTTYGTKDRSWPAYEDMPAHTDARLLVALTGLMPEEFQQHGWQVVAGWLATETPAAYQSFIRQSSAEFSVAKHGYVAARSGWFSDRSACYLAAGRPVVVQDTGLDRLRDHGGMLTFTDPAGAVRQIGALMADYDAHCRAARTLASDVFDAALVLPPLLESW
jgi:hypothetical protein